MAETTTTTTETTTSSSSGNSTETAEKLVKQIDYYFGDSNYPKDKFLRAKAKEHPQNYIPVKILLTFNRVKQLTTDVGVLTDALKKSTEVELNDDSTMLRRIRPVPAEDTSTARSIYSKGWPKDTTIEKVTEFFSPHGKVLSVYLRRLKDTTKEFKGSLTVEFSTEDEAKAVIAAAPQLEGHTLVYQSKDEWVQEKREAYKKKKESKKEAKQEGGEKRKATEEPDADTEDDYPRNTILFFKDIGADQTREDVKPIFEEFGEVAFVDFKAKKVEGHVRFSKPEDAAKALQELTDSKREFAGKVPTLHILVGEEEKVYWKRVADGKKARGGRARGGRARGGKRGGRGKSNKTQKL